MRCGFNDTMRAHPVHFIKIIAPYESELLIVGKNTTLGTRGVLKAASIAVEQTRGGIASLTFGVVTKKLSSLTK